MAEEKRYSVTREKANFWKELSKLMVELRHLVNDARQLLQEETKR